MSVRKFHEIWIEQCDAAQDIKLRYGLKAAFDYVVAEKLLNFASALSETASGWRLTENRAMLLFNEGTFQAHWLDGCRSISVAGSARGRNLDIAAAN